MARLTETMKPSLSLLLILVSVLTISFPTPTQAYSKTFNNIEDAEQLVGLDLKKQKLTHFRIYWHDLVAGPKPTSVQVVKPVPLKSPTAFGLINMIDNALTHGPNMESKPVGRAQGFYASACQTNVGLLMNMNFVFMEGKYNGSSFTVLGRNMVLSKVREMAITGGSGLFRFATGYVEAKTHSFDASTGNAIVQYDCYVMHY